MREMKRAMLDEFMKIAAHSAEEAQRALEQLHGLEENRPSLGQVARYAVLGALAGPAVGIGRKMIQTGGAQKGLTEYFGPNLLSSAGLARHLTGDMLAGATTSGAIPLVRGALDRAALRRSLKHYLAHQEEP